MGKNSGMPTWAQSPTSKSKEALIVSEEIDHGPPPSLSQRKLIFNALQRTQINNDAGSGTGLPNGGTYLYGWGSGRHGQMGTKVSRGQEKTHHTPQFVPFGEPIRQISCSSNNCACVTDAGHLYVWGEAPSTGHKFLSIPTEANNIWAALQTTRLTQVACGTSHTIVLDEDGNIWAWGSSKFGETGLNTIRDVKSPKKIVSEYQFTKVACGGFHTAAISRGGQLLTWGQGKHGQLGHSKTFDEGGGANFPYPKVVESLEEVIVDVDCGQSFTCALTETGDLFVFGFGEHIYLKDKSFSYKPVHIPFQKRVLAFSCGHSHILVVLEDHSLYAWGASDHGQVGHGKKMPTNSPRLILDGSHRIMSASAGRYFSFAVDAYGIAYSWGHNTYGELCQNCKKNVVSPKPILVPKPVHCLKKAVVATISCGDYHALAITSVHHFKSCKSTDAYMKSMNHEFKLKRALLGKMKLGSTLQKSDLFQIREKMEKYHRKKRKSEDTARRELENFDVVRDLHLKTWTAKDVQSVTKLKRPKTARPMRSARSSFSGKAKKKKRSVTSRRPRTAPLKAKQNERNHLNANKLPTQYLKQQKTMLKDSQADFSTRTRHMVGEYAEIQANRSLFESRKRCDKVTTERIALEKRLEKLKSMVALIEDVETESQCEESHGAKVGGKIQKSLNRVLLKIKEKKENTETYKSQITHMNEERMQLAWNIDSLKKQLQEYKSLEGKIQSVERMCSVAHEDTCMSLHNFEEEVNSFRKFFQRRIKDYKQIKKHMQKRNVNQRKKSKKIFAERRRVEKRITRLCEDLELLKVEKTKLNDKLLTLQSIISFSRNPFMRIQVASGAAVDKDGRADIMQMANKHRLNNKLQIEMKSEILAKQDIRRQKQAELKKLLSQLQRQKNYKQQTSWLEIDGVEEQTTQKTLVEDKMRLEVQDMNLVLLTSSRFLFSSIEKLFVFPEVDPYDYVDQSEWETCDFLDVCASLKKFILHAERAVKNF